MALTNYDKLIARVASGMPVIDPMAKPKSVDADDPGPSISELVLTFSAHAEKHYVKNGTPTSAVQCFQSCLRLLRELYGMMPARDFGPLALKAVRAKMVEGDPKAKDSSGNRCCSSRNHRRRKSPSRLTTW